MQQKKKKQKQNNIREDLYLVQNNKHLRKYIEKTFLVTCRENDVLCGRCRREYYTNTRQQRNRQGISGPEPFVQPEAKSSMEFSPKNITLPLPSIGGSHSRCCVCKKRGPKLIVVSSKAGFNCFLYKNVIIPYRSRCCPVHIADDMMTEEAVNVMNNFRQNTNFNRTDILNLLGKVPARHCRRKMKRELTSILLSVIRT